MIISDNTAIENALLYDVYYSNTYREWDEITEDAHLADVIVHWFCKMVLTNPVLFPKVPEDRGECLYRTYALAAVLAGFTSKDHMQTIINKAQDAFYDLFPNTEANSKKFMVEKLQTVCSYELAFMDSAKGVEDSIAAIELAYMYMSGIPRESEHARALSEICYAWMYVYNQNFGNK